MVEVAAEFMVFIMVFIMRLITLRGLNFEDFFFKFLKNTKKSHHSWEVLHGFIESGITFINRKKVELLIRLFDLC